MMFLQWIKKALRGGYQFCDGSSLLNDGRDALIYESPEGRRVTVQAELWDKNTGIERCVYSSEIKEWHPPHAAPVTAEERRHIVEKIEAFYRKTGISYKIMGSSDSPEQALPVTTAPMFPSSDVQAAGLAPGAKLRFFRFLSG